MLPRWWRGREREHFDPLRQVLVEWYPFGTPKNCLPALGTVVAPQSWVDMLE